MPLISYCKCHLLLRRLPRAAKYLTFTALLFIIAFTQTLAEGGQQTISLSVNNAPLEKVFKEIQKQSGYAFVYTRELLHNTKPISIKVSNAHIDEVLTLCVKDQPVTFLVAEKMVIIRPKPEVKGGENIYKQAEANGDPGDISGRVIDAQGNPLVGANIKIKGTNTGTVTDVNGRFILHNVEANAALEISFVGHEAQTVTVRGKDLLSIVLNPKNSILDETVVIAYGTTTRRLATGNISTVKAKDIEKQPVQNPLLALQGRVTGVTIEQANGMPGTGVKIRIQGGTSLSSGNEPLYVIDDVPYQPLMPRSQSDIQVSSQKTGLALTNPLTYINPQNIESIEILKDADATSIYGSRAANGAVLITTKKGKAGKAKVDINLQHGWSKVGHFVDVLNTEQYMEMRNEAYFINDGLTTSSTQYATQYDINGTWDKNRYTNWQKTLFGGTARYTDAQLAVSGGTNNTNFRFGGGYNRVTTVFPGDLSDKKGSASLSVTHASTDQRFKLQVTANYLADNNKLMAPADLTKVAIELPPNAPSLYNNDGSLNWAPNLAGTASTWRNPLAYLQQKFNQQVENLTGSAIISYKLLPGLDIKTNVGYNKITRNEIVLIPLTYEAPERRSTASRSSTFDNYRSVSWIIEPQLTYTKPISKGQLECLLGSTFSANKDRQESILAYGFTTDQLMQNITSAPNVTPLSTSGADYRYNALFGRVNYNWKNKYILNLTARRDGSSRFGAENLFHNFGSVAGAWIFSNENFIQKNLSILSFGKLRASYGTTGNDQIGNYGYLNTYFSQSVPVPYQGQVGLFTADIPNPYLQWEETKKLQAGVDLGFIQDKFLLAVNYYYNRSSNQIQGYSLPAMAGVGSITINFPATVQNSGWELSLSTTNIGKRNFKWSSSVNFTFPKNKLVAYPNLEKSSFASLYIIGQPVTLVKAYHSLGVDPATGLFIFSNINGDIVTNPVFFTDRTQLFNSSAKFFGGVQNSLQFKGFVLDFLFQFVRQFGADLRYGNTTAQPGRFASNNTIVARGNQPVTILDRWQKPGDDAFFQRFSATWPSSLNTPYGSVRISDANFYDISYIKLKNLSFSWQLPLGWQQKIHVQNARLYVQGQNLWTITNYTGLDPESGTNTLPPLKTWTIGFQLTL